MPTLGAVRSGREQVEESIGVAGLNPLIDYRGQKDLLVTLFGSRTSP